MKYLNSEHISMLAVWLWPHSNCDPKLAVERAIALVREAQEQCQEINRKTGAHD